MQIGAALAASHGALFGRVPDTRQCVGTTWNARQVGQSIGQQGRLIVFSQEQTPGMQRNGNNEIRLGQKIGAGTCHPPREVRRAAGSIGMFETQHQPFAGPVVAKDGPRPTIAGRIKKTPTANCGFAGIDIKRLAATHTGGWAEKGDRVPTVGTERTLSFRQTAAGKAARRNCQIERDSRHPDDHRRQNTQQRTKPWHDHQSMTLCSILAILRNSVFDSCEDRRPCPIAKA